PAHAGDPGIPDCRRRPDGLRRDRMRAMVLAAPGNPLAEVDLPAPDPGPTEVLLRVHACGVCRTDLHIRDGELTQPKLPLILGPEIVGTVEGGGGAVRGG